MRNVPSMSKRKVLALSLHCQAPLLETVHVQTTARNHPLRSDNFLMMRHLDALWIRTK